MGCVPRVVNRVGFGARVLGMCAVCPSCTPTRPVILSAAAQLSLSSTGENSGNAASLVPEIIRSEFPSIQGDRVSNDIAIYIR